MVRIVNINHRHLLSRLALIPTNLPSLRRRALPSPHLWVPQNLP